MSIIVFIILILIAIPISIWIAKRTDKRQGKNYQQWQEYRNQQSEIESLEDRLNELKGR